MRVLLVLGFVAYALCASVPSSNEEAVDYTGYKLMSINIKNVESSKAFEEIARKYKLDLWNDSPRTGEPTLVLSSPEYVEDAQQALSKAAISWTVVQDNIQAVIDEERDSQNISSRSYTADRKEFVFTRYMMYEEIVDAISYYAETYPFVEKIVMQGKSFEGREIVGAKIASDGGKPIVFLECGIHAREWIAPAFCNYLIHELATNPDAYKDLLDRYEFNIYPSVNPDGYVYTKTNRLWRKNRQPSGDGCYGTDLNRNFDIGPFCGVGTSKDPCEEIFCGTAPFSEPETQAIRDEVLRIKDRVQFYISFHSFGLMWMFPYSYKTDLSPDHEELLRKAQLGAAALKAIAGTKYKVGPIATTIYSVTGSTIDWAYEKAGVKNSYVLELQPGRGSSSGFVLPASKIIPTCEETIVGIKTLLTA